MQQAKDTLAAVKDAADTFNVQVKAIGGGVDKFTGRGFGDLQNLVNSGQRTISHLDSVISDLERNPSQFLFGGNAAPVYRGQRH
jgi:phospholipid/cholesterol/gamma-HCH transport system substrate-binding protein